MQPKGTAFARRLALRAERLAAGAGPVHAPAGLTRYPARCLTSPDPRDFAGIWPGSGQGFDRYLTRAPCPQVPRAVEKAGRGGERLQLASCSFVGRVAGRGRRSAMDRRVRSPVPEEVDGLPGRVSGERVVRSGRVDVARAPELPRRGSPFGRGVKGTTTGVLAPDPGTSPKPSGGSCMRAACGRGPCAVNPRPCPDRRSGSGAEGTGRMPGAFCRCAPSGPLLLLGKAAAFGMGAVPCPPENRSGRKGLSASGRHFHPCPSAVLVACTAVMAMAATMSWVLQPRDRSLAGWARPCRMGPMAMRPPRRWAIL